MIITRLSEPDYGIIPLSLIAEFIGFDSDLDVEQNKVLPMLRAAVVQDGEQITGVIWPAAQYRIEGLCTYFGHRRLPVLPAASVGSVSWIDNEGDKHRLESKDYSFTASNIEFGQPYGCIELLARPDAASLTVEVTAGWTEDTFPDCLRSWALNRIATLYDYREDLVTGTITASMPRHHSMGLLDAYTVRVGYA